MRLVILGDDNAAAGLFIEAVDDAGTMFLRSGGESAAVVEQGIDQRPLVMTGPDMDDHASRLVDDNEVFILVQDAQRNVLGACTGGRLVDFLLDAEDIAGMDLLTVPDGLAAQRDAAGFHEGLDFGTREVRKVAHQDHVEPLAAILFGCGDFVYGWIGHGFFLALRGQAA